MGGNEGSHPDFVEVRICWYLLCHGVHELSRVFRVGIVSSESKSSRTNREVPFVRTTDLFSCSLRESWIDSTWTE